MSNSALVSYTKISPNRTSPRNHVIDTITPHCYVGEVTAEDAAAWFAQPSAELSCNYFIDKDGRIALIVPEGDRSWCSSNRENDNRAVTIECASGKTHPYAINDKVYKSLVRLCADICKRNGIKELKWLGNKSLIGQVDVQNITAHRWFANKACPGDYIYNRLGVIASEVNARLGVDASESQNGFQAALLQNLSEEDRIKRIAPLYVESMKKTGLLASVRIAQFCLEAAYGSTDLAVYANNLHGMKTELSGNTWEGSVWDGVSKYGKYSPEVINGNPVMQYSHFRQYACCEDSIADQAAYFLNAMNGSEKRYPGLKGEKDYEKAIRIIKAGGYATDPDYVSKLCDIVRRWKLYEYDEIPAAEEKSVILAQCEKFQKQLEADLAVNKRWTYHNPAKFLEEQWSSAVRKERRACNCALLARWALKEAGLIPQSTGIFYGKKGGTISWGRGTKDAVSKSCHIIKIGNRTVKELIASGTLRPGDIVTYVNIQHTNIYAGDNSWYDAGHAYCTGFGEGAVYNSWHGKTIYANQLVGYIIRPKDKEPDCDLQDNEYVVQAGSFTKRANAVDLVSKLHKKGFDAILKEIDGQYKVQCGAFSIVKNAEKLVSKLKKAGFDAFIK